MHRKKTFFASVVAALIICANTPVVYASTLEVSGWIPYWGAKEGTRDAKRHLDELSVIHPFSYVIKQDGTLKDVASMRKSYWKTLLKEAQEEDVLVVPTVMTSNGDLVHELLSSKKKRAAHIKAIEKLVDRNDYDGIDIDYEGKYARTREYYSTFLKELKKALGNKTLSCTIEARTPPDSLYVTVPDTIAYANDFEVIAKYCDRVNIMAYDQQRADIKLNKERKGAPYVPVADADWVEKVLELTLKTIPNEKVVLGVATYGHEYEIIVAPEWYRDYNKVRALNIPAIEKLAKQYGVKPSRNSAGELGFSYFPNKSAPQLSTKAPTSTKSGEMVAAQTLAYATETGKESVFYYVSWSDADAIKEKVALANKYDLQGIALFKIDGQEDAGIWKLFEE